MRTRAALAAISLLLALPPALMAQGDIRFGVGGGLIVPVRSHADVIRKGWIGDASLTYFPAASTSLGLRLDGLYGRANLRAVTGRQEYLGGTANLVFQFGSRRTPNRFYVLGGGGYVRTRTTGPGFGESRETSPTIDGGAGFSLGGRGLALYVEGRYVSIYTNGSKPQFLGLTGGVTFGGF
jgi:hypothetical protein